MLKGSALKSARIVRNACLCKFESVASKRNQRRRDHHLRLRQDAVNARNRFRKALARQPFVYGSHQAGRQIAAIASVDRRKFIFALIEFV